MRIALAIEYFDPSRGGAEQWTFQFAQRLLARGHEVHVVAQGFSAAGEELPIFAHRLGRIRSRLQLAAAAERVLRPLLPDVVHDMGMGWYCDLFESHDGSRLAQWQQKLALLPPWARRIKREMIRVLPRYRTFRRLFARQLGDRNRLVLALSKMVASDFQRYHAVRPEQIRVIYNGVDTERFSPEHRARYRHAVRRRLGLDENDVLLLFVGHDFQRKGLASAIRAVGRLASERRPVRMAVVGRKSPRAYRRLARACGAGDAVKFIGSIDDPVPYYAASDVYVLPTFYDPCSLGLLEAISSGLPSVTTRFNGAAELLSDKVDGYVIDEAADDRALADRLRLLMDPEHRRQMGESARRLALGHTMDRNCDEIVSVYHEIVGRRRRPAACPAREVGQQHLPVTD